MYKIAIRVSMLTFLLCNAIASTAQDNQKDRGNITGNFQMDAQYYLQDSIIGTPEYPENIGSNSFVNLIYTKGNFKAGIRYEAYFPTLQGFTRETGSGIPYRFAQYTHEKFDITAGTFYEQFGSGMTLRTYEEWGLGFDNSIDGVRLKFTPVKGVYLTGLMGRQRNSFSNKIENLSEGLIRAADIDLSLNDIIAPLAESKARIRLGASIVSRYQEDTDPIQIYPENVTAFAGRASFNYSRWNAFVEYAYKINDPSAVNNIIYKPGNGLLLQASYSQKGLGISLSAKRIDNLDFRSDRTATFNNQTLNFLPPQSKQHTYRLPTLFPYATQTTGEMGLQAEVLYKIKKGSLLGGKYGTNLSFNFSRIHNIDRQTPNDPDNGYASDFFRTGALFFQDINLEVSHKFNKKFKGTFTYLYFIYEKALFKQLTGLNSSKDVRAHVQVLDMSYKIKPKHTLRTEVQHVYTQQEFGSWAMLLVEYSIAPNWFFAAFDEYNYGNEIPEQRLHYLSASLGRTFKTYRITAGYGRQRAGVLCVGGVCRVLPASNGFTLSITGNF